MLFPVKSKQIVTLDVREDLARGREPFGKIMRTVAGLKTTEDLLLIAPFEPAPLYKVLRQQGFVHHPKPTASGDWEVLFTRSAEPLPEPLPARPPAPQSQVCAGTPSLEVDARGLEPPQPLVTILEAVATLPAGAQLRAFTDRRPMHLYSELEARGFVGETEAQPDGSFLTLIRRAQ